MKGVFEVQSSAAERAGRRLHLARWWKLSSRYCYPLNWGESIKWANGRRHTNTTEPQWFLVSLFLPPAQKNMEFNYALLNLRCLDLILLLFFPSCLNNSPIYSEETSHCVESRFWIRSSRTGRNGCREIHLPLFLDFFWKLFLAVRSVFVCCFGAVTTNEQRSGGLKSPDSSEKSLFPCRVSECRSAGQFPSSL